MSCLIWSHPLELTTCLRQKLYPLSELLVFKRLTVAPADVLTAKSSQMQCQEKERHADIAVDTSFFLLKKSLSRYSRSVGFLFILPAQRV